MTALPADTPTVWHRAPERPWGLRTVPGNQDDRIFI